MKPLLRVGVPLWSLLIASALFKVGVLQNAHFTHNLNWRVYLFIYFLNDYYFVIHWKMNFVVWGHLLGTGTSLKVQTKEMWRN